VDEVVEYPSRDTLSNLRVSSLWVKTNTICRMKTIKYKAKNVLWKQWVCVFLVLVVWYDYYFI
jgi:hypothetical protein